MVQDGSGGAMHSTAAACAPPLPPSSSSHPPLLRRLSVRHEHAVLVQWDGEEQSTLDSVLAKLPFSKHSALERYEVFFPCPMKKKNSASGQTLSC